MGDRDGPLTEAELLAQEEAYLMKIQQNKDKKFQSKVFGTNLQSARDGGVKQFHNLNHWLIYKPNRVRRLTKLTRLKRLLNLPKPGLVINQGYVRCFLILFLAWA